MSDKLVQSQHPYPSPTEISPDSLFDGIMYCRWWDVQGLCSFMLRSIILQRNLISLCALFIPMYLTDLLPFKLIHFKMLLQLFLFYYTYFSSLLFSHPNFYWGALLLSSNSKWVNIFVHFLSSNIWHVWKSLHSVFISINVAVSQLFQSLGCSVKAWPHLENIKEMEWVWCQSVMHFHMYT